VPTPPAAGVLPILRADGESPANTGAAGPVAAARTQLALDRTQEVAGSSPASSIFGKSLQRCYFVQPDGIASNQRCDG
jgi:hypothetical protein